jgi:hypothetical protein
MKTSTKLHLQRLSVALITLFITLSAMAQQAMTSTTTTWNGEYTVTGDVTINGEVSLSGDATVNLAEGATLNINGKIHGFVEVGNRHALTIIGSGTMNVTCSKNQAGLFYMLSALTVNGGTVNITNNDETGGFAIFSKIDDGPVVLNGGTLHTTVVYEHSGHFAGTNIILAGGTLQTDGGNSICTKPIIIADGYVYEDKSTEKLYYGSLSNNEIQELLGHEVAHNPDAYTVTIADEEGVTMTADCRAAKVGHTVNVTAEATVAGYLIGASYNDGTDHALTLKDNGKCSFTMPAANVTISATPTLALTKGDGSTNNPYLIEDVADWDVLCLLINNNATNNVNQGKCFKLGNDISVTSKIGGSNVRTFMGTFDGSGHTLTVTYDDSRYCAPFRYVSDATIKNLHVAGTITTENKYTAGIVGEVTGNSTVTIANCRSSVTINSSVSGASYHGGLVGEVYNGATVNINDCVFDGKILTDGSTTSTKCGGFVGQCYHSGTANLTNCLYAPAALQDGETLAQNNSNTFVCSGTNITITNCYYTQVFGGKQGTQADYLLSEDKVVPSTMTAGKTVVFRREFNGGKASTICLPFEYTPAETEGTYYSFKGIELEGDEYVATMTAAATTLKANTPYVFMPAAADTYVPVLYHGTADYNDKNLTATSGDWTFRGTYEKLIYGDNLDGHVHVYGFAAKTKEVGNVTVNAGEFVKAKTGASIKPMRCYLTYNKNGGVFAGTRGAEDLPQTITVRFIGANGEVTSIGTLNTQTGEITTSDAWYTLSGTRLPSKPTQRGIYIHNGKKVVIK